MFNTHPNTVNVQRHRPNTIQYPPKHSPGTIYALIEVNRNKLHQQTLPDIPRPSQVLFEDGWSLKVSVDVTWCLLICVGFFCCLDMSCYVGGGGGVGVMGVYEWCLWVSEVFAGVWRVISVLTAHAHPLNGGEFILFWHSPEKPNCFHQAKLRHQNVHIYPEQKWLGFVIF